MDETLTTSMHPEFDPRAAWEAARASSELYWQERRRIQEARRLEALASLCDDDLRPTLLPASR